MEFTKLNQRDSQALGATDFAAQLGDDSVSAKYGLLPHTDEELRNLEFKPGLTLEELQQQSRAGQTPPSRDSDGQQFVTVYQADPKRRSESGSKLHSGEVSEEFDHGFDEEAHEAPSHQKHHSHKHSHSHSHGHGHKHHAGCKHGHEHHSHSDKKLKNQVDRYKVPLRLLIYSIQLTHYLYIYLAITPLFEDRFYAWATRTACSFFFGVTFYSHLTVSLSSSLSFDRKKDKAFLSRQPYNTCEKCDGIWKPQRTHHCSVQNHDVLRMDHYCPVTLNTIGYRSHGAFFVTAVGHLVASSDETVCSIWMVLLPLHLGFHFREVMPEKSSQRILLSAFWLLDYFMVLGLFGLAMSMAYHHSLFILTNSTTLESMREEGRTLSQFRRRSLG